MKVKTEELFQNEETKEKWQINAMWDSELNYFVIENIIEITGKPWMGSED